MYGSEGFYRRSVGKVGDGRREGGSKDNTIAKIRKGKEEGFVIRGG